MILGDVEETITTVEIDEETFEEIIKVREDAAAKGGQTAAAVQQLAAARQQRTDLFLLLQTTKRMVQYLFVRGDGVILVSPPIRS